MVFERRTIPMQKVYQKTNRKSNDSLCIHFFKKSLPQNRFSCIMVPVCRNMFFREDAGMMDGIRSLFQNKGVKKPVREEEELVLKLDKSEILDSHIILPHAELNELVYEAVNRFIERYGGSSLKITFVSGIVSEDVQDVIRESYRAHYLDVMRKSPDT